MAKTCRTHVALPAAPGSYLSAVSIGSLLRRRDGLQTLGARLKDQVAESGKLHWPDASKGFINGAD